MPVVIVYGVPIKTPTDMLETLIPSLQLMVEGVQGMDTKADLVKVFFPMDLVIKGLSEEIIIFVILHDKPSRTPDVLKEVAYRVGYMTKNRYFKDALVEVFIQTTNSVLFWSSKK